MSFPTHLARALAPVAIVALAVPAEAQQSDIAKVEAHLSAVQSMTANFTQTDSRNRVARGTLQLKRPGRIRFQYDGNDLVLVVAGHVLLDAAASSALRKASAGPVRNGEGRLVGVVCVATRETDPIEVRDHVVMNGVPAENIVFIGPDDLSRPEMIERTARVVESFGRVA